MRILITGNMGYVGAALVRFLRAELPDSELIGFDSGYFGVSLTGAHVVPETLLDEQHFGDVRKFPRSLLDGVDSVVHLAAISNDPMGGRFEDVTKDVNQESSVRIAELARDAEVKNFVFASSCSMYGYAEGGRRNEGDPTNPLTAYARSKIGTEQILGRTDLGDMVITNLRFATACGMSDRLRLDLVLNDFVACAVTAKKISVLSDGSPWRPLIDVEDMARAILWAVDRSVSNGGRFLSVNVGSNDWNFQVKDLAEAVAHTVPGTIVSVNDQAPPDNRSYQVDFSLLQKLAPNHTPRMSLNASIIRIRDGLVAMGFKDQDFRNSPFIRLRMLEQHIASGRLTDALYWAKKSVSSVTA